MRAVSPKKLRFKGIVHSLSMPPLQRKAKQSSEQCKSRLMLRSERQSLARNEGKDMIRFDAHIFGGWVFKPELRS